MRALDESRTGSHRREITIGENHFLQSLHRLEGVCRIRIYGVDITQQRRAERERQSALESLRQVQIDWERTFDNIPDLVFLLDQEHRIVRVNRPAAERLGVTPQQCVGMHCYECVHGLDRPPGFCPHAQTMADGMRHSCELTEDGFGGDYLVTTTPVIDEHGVNVGSVHVATEITEIRRREEELRQAAEELARSNRDLEQFAYIASHDLQEPLRMVTGFVQLLQQRYHDKLDATGIEFIEFAVDGAQRMQMLIQDLLAYSRVGTRGEPRSATDSGEALQRAMANLGVRIRETAAEISYGPLPTVRADGRQLTQLFQNLLSNAMKFRGMEPPRIHVEACRSDNGWEFTVHDNGIGIDPEFHERVFEIFQRLHTRRQYPGTGIGLAICRRIADRHGGSIWVDSRLGDGTTFHFTIPD